MDIDKIYQEKNRLYDEMEALEGRLNKVKGEYKELTKAIETLEKFSTSNHVRTSHFTKSNLTIMEMVVEILKKFPTGLSASNILELIHDRYDNELERTSLSPQLSRLKQRGELSYNNGKWLLAETTFPFLKE